MGGKYLARIKFHHFITYLNVDQNHYFLHLLFTSEVLFLLITPVDRLIETGDDECCVGGILVFCAGVPGYARESEGDALIA